jgi:hypothetical protein
MDKYVKQVDAAARYLLKKQDKSGAFSSDMYGHALATLAICELFGMSQDAEMREPAQKALNYLVQAQTPEGGWRYQPKRNGYDTSVGVWVLEALKVGEWAGLDVPEKTYTNCAKWLDHAGSDAISYGYAADVLDAHKPPATKRMSSAGIRCRQLLGWQVHHTLSPSFAKDDVLYNYNTSLWLFQGTIVRGPKHFSVFGAWDAWNPVMVDTLIRSQDRGTDALHAHQIASWYSSDDPVVAHYGGRLMQTCLSLLMLEIYYREMRCVY